MSSHLWRHRETPGARVLNGRLDEAVSWCDMALACSGTVTLNLLRQCCPMLGVYKASRLSTFLSRFVLKAPYRLLPNIVAGSEIVPERVPYCGGPGLLAKDILYLLQDSRRLEAQRAAMRIALSKFKGPAFAPTCVDVLEEVMAMGTPDAIQR